MTGPTCGWCGQVATIGVDGRNWVCVRPPCDRVVRAMRDDEMLVQAITTWRTGQVGNLWRVHESVSGWWRYPLISGQRKDAAILMAHDENFRDGLSGPQSGDLVSAEVMWVRPDVADAKRAGFAKLTDLYEQARQVGAGAESLVRTHKLRMELYANLLRVARPPGVFELVASIAGTHYEPTADGYDTTARQGWRFMGLVEGRYEDVVAYALSKDAFIGATGLWRDSKVQPKTVVFVTPERSDELEQQAISAAEKVEAVEAAIAAALAELAQG